jgi:hypothetical protein
MPANHHFEKKDRRRTHTASDAVLEIQAVADIEGARMNACLGAGQFDPEECDSLKAQRLAERIELFNVLNDWLGERYFKEMLDLFVFCSTRDLNPGNPSKPQRQKDEERLVLRRLILLGTFGFDHGVASKTQTALDLSRAENMAETILSAILRSRWTIVSPRTARAIRPPNAWAVPIGGCRLSFRSLSEDEARDYIWDRADTLFAEQDTYLTVRQRDGIIELDIVKPFAELDCACSFAKMMEQQRIINLKTQQWIDPESDRHEL